MAMMVRSPHDAVMTTAGTPNAGMTTPTSTEPYKLRRARKGRMLAGVAAGLATASGLDVTIVRICIGASMLTGLGVIGYLLLWIVIPEEQPSRGRYVEPAPESTARVIRVLLLGGALLVLLQKLGIFWPFENRYGHTSFGFDGVLALVLLSVGVGVLVSRHRSDGWLSSDTAPPTAPPPSEPPFTPWTAPNATPPADDDTTILTVEHESFADLDSEDNYPDQVGFVGPFRDIANTVHRDVTDALASARQETRIKKPGGAALGWARVVGWLVLLWWLAGLAALLGVWRFGAVNITGPVLFFGVCWTVFTIVLNALIRVRKPAVVLGTLFTLLIPVGIAQGMVRADGPMGARTFRPVQMGQHATYRVAMGQLDLDLADAQLAKSRATDIDASMGVGHMSIVVPNNVSLTVVTDIKAGGYAVLGKETTGGIGQRETLRFDGCEGAPHLRLHITGGAGWMEVQRASGGNEATCPAAA